ncbi:hypothetical protein [Desulforhopalus sp. 52FAK]
MSDLAEILVESFRPGLAAFNLENTILHYSLKIIVEHCCVKQVFQGMRVLSGFILITYMEA